MTFRFKSNNKYKLFKRNKLVFVNYKYSLAFTKSGGKKKILMAPIRLMYQVGIQQILKLTVKPKYIIVITIHFSRKMY